MVYRHDRAFISPPPALDFHYADSVSIVFHRRRGRGETSVHASNLIRLGEIYICYRRRIPLFKVVASLSILLPPAISLPIPHRFTMFSSDHELVLLEFISGPVDSGATPKLPDIPRFASPRFSPGTLIYLPPGTLQLRPETRWILRDVHYWSIFGVKRAHPEITALFVGGFTTDIGTMANFRPKNHQEISCASTVSWKIVTSRETKLKLDLAIQLY